MKIARKVLSRGNWRMEPRTAGRNESSGPVGISWTRAIRCTGCKPWVVQWIRTMARWRMILGRGGRAYRPECWPCRRRMHAQCSRPSVDSRGSVSGVMGAAIRSRPSLTCWLALEGRQRGMQTCRSVVAQCGPAAYPVVRGRWYAISFSATRACGLIMPSRRLAALKPPASGTVREQCVALVDERQCDGPGSVWEDGQCFKRLGSYWNFVTAQSKCISWGGALASIRSEAQTLAVVELLGGARAWIGLRQAAYNQESGTVFAPAWMAEALEQQTEGNLRAGATVGDSYLNWASGEQATFGNARSLYNGCQGSTRSSTPPAAATEDLSDSRWPLDGRPLPSRFRAIA